MIRDAEFRKWYDARLGVKSESFAYDVWCAAWAKAKNTLTEAEPACECTDKPLCEFNDRCMKRD